MIAAGELPVDDDSLYVMAMVDPDAPSADDPSMAEVRHYLVGNINSVSFDDSTRPCTALLNTPKPSTPIP